MQLNLIYDSSVDGAPSGFKVAMAAAAQFLDTLITNPITVNIQVGFGEDDGTLLTGNESTGGPSPGPGATGISHSPLDVTPRRAHGHPRSAHEQGGAGRQAPCQNGRRRA